MKNTDNYNDFNNFTHNKNDNTKIFIKFLLLSIPANILLLSLIGSVI